jgi:carboxypeptidase Taq
VGLPLEYADQPVGHDRGMALEESQSLLMEMMVCRSRGFVTYLKPLLEKHFGVSGAEWSEENLYAHLTRVKRGPIRVDADELTYTLHIQLRYELENQLLSGELAVRNLRDAWNSSMEQRLGVKPQTDLEGVLQDVHWAVGSFGYFPSYALGAVMAAQFFEALREAVPDIEAQIARGEFAGLITWLRENVHSQGARVSTQELLKLSTGKPLSAVAALRYLESKYLGDESVVGSAAA